MIKAYYYLLINYIDDVSMRYLPKSIALCLFCLSRVIIVHEKKLEMLMLSHRVYPLNFIQNSVLVNIHILKDYSKKLIVPDKVVPDRMSRNRSIVLKPFKLGSDGVVVEKGVLLIKFSTTFKYFIKNINCKKLQDYFLLVLEPSWAGYCLPEVLAWCAMEGPIVIECSEKRDYDFIRSLKSNLIPVRFGSSDWVDHTRFFPMPHEKKIYDVIYVSNYNKIKRNHAYLRAIKNIDRPGFRAALVCNSWGDSKSATLELIKYYGINDRLDIYEALSQDQINVLLAKSKINVLLSLKEGSNRSIFESMFADTPCLVLEDNIGVNKEYITRETGRLIKESELSSNIEDMSNGSQQYSPRNWAMKNISVYSTKEKLDAILEAECIRTNLRWTAGTLLKVNNPEANYFDPEEIGRNLTSEEVCNIFDCKLGEDDINRLVKQTVRKYSGYYHN